MALLSVLVSIINPSFYLQFLLLPVIIDSRAMDNVSAHPGSICYLFCSGFATLGMVDSCCHFFLVIHAFSLHNAFLSAVIMICPLNTFN